MTVLASVVGYLIGSLPTANGLAHLWGVDLRSTGSGNPGTNNARRAGGLPLAVLVLVAELAKGVLAVYVGHQLAGDLGAVLAGVTAAAGNVYNVWYRFEGGKGLAISAGVVLAAWPPAFLIVVGVIIALTILTRSSGIAAIGTFATLIFLSFLWPRTGISAWGIEDTSLYPWLAIGLSVVLFQKHFNDARSAIRRRARR